MSLLTGVFDYVMQNKVFAGAEALWDSALDKIIEFVESNEGQAGSKQVFSQRFELE